jgi:hypothetical protein
MFISFFPFPPVLSLLPPLYCAVMSFRAPRSGKRTSRSPSKATSTTLFNLVPSETVVPQCKPWGSSSDRKVQPQRDVYRPDGVFAQVNVPGMSLPQHQYGDANNQPLLFTTPALPSSTLSNSKKKERQWTKWATVAIPSLLTPYLALLHQTNSLQNNIPESLEISCACLSHVRKINVACIYFERKCTLTWSWCGFSNSRCRNHCSSSLLVFCSSTVTIKGFISMFSN